MKYPQTNPKEGVTLKWLTESLNMTRENLFRSISTLSASQINVKPTLDSWSVSQVCHHLYLTEVLFTKAISRGLQSNIDVTTERKPIELVLDKTKSFESPDIAKPLDGFFSDYQEIDKSLLKSRAVLNDLLENIDDISILTRRSYKHPIFNELLLEQWIELLDLHEQRHIEQINRIKKMLLV
jgi:hypothetical protein